MAVNTMAGGRWGRVVTVLVAAALVALLAGQLLGQPILLGFVETGSMEPTIDAGDGFVAIPAAVADDPEPGDVVVFEAETIQGGGLTTHRIVAETDRGYVTHGDANPFTDQDGGEPPVQDAQLVAVAWQPGGSVVTIPHLGTAVMGVGDALEGVQLWLATTLGLDVLFETAGLAYVVLAISLVLYAVETVRERRSPSFSSRTGRSTEEGFDPRYLAAGLALVIVVAAGAAMVVPAGAQSYGVVSAEFDSERPLVVERGTTDDVPYEVENGGLVPVVSYVESDGDVVSADPGRTTVGPRGDETVTLSVTAPQDTGHYPAYVTEYRYLHVLPLPVIDALHDLHPWAPIVVILGLIGGGTYAAGRRLVRHRDVRSRRAAGRDGRSTPARLRRRP